MRKFLAILSLLAAASGGAARAQFVEDVDLLRFFQGDQDGDLFGWVAANVGDVNGDGVDDLLIPAIGHDGIAGRATLFSGVDGAVLNDIVNPNGVRIGYSAAGAGDVDGDGTPDYILGGVPVQVISGATNAVLHDVTATVGFASSVTGGGDLDGDGLSDFVAAAQGGGDPATQPGKVWAFSGADGSVLWTREGAAPGARLGAGLGVVGDVNGDGRADVSACATGIAEGYLLDGADGSTIHTFLPAVPEEAQTYGEFFCRGGADVDRDGIGDVFVGDYFAGAGDALGTGAAYVYSGATGETLHAFAGFRPGDGLGPGRIVPDLNGDGFGDVVVAGYTSSAGAPGAGQTYVFSGRSGALLRTITHTNAGDAFGVDALVAGDANLDGRTDFLVTALGLSFNGTDPGRAYLIAGEDLPCPSDLSGNGWVGPIDLLLFKFGLHTQDPSADLDGDDSVDVEDLRVLLRDLGRCPPGRPRR